MQNTDFFEAMQQFYRLLDTLNPDDCGRQVIGNFVLRFEGFSDWCQQDVQERLQLPKTNPRYLVNYEDVYEEVLDGWIHEQESQPLNTGFAGTTDHPIQWAVFNNKG